MVAVSKLKPQRYQATPDGEFVIFENVPVFKEHVGIEGEVEVYDRQKLQWICDNMNRRIRDTGDFTPIVVQHTPTPEDEAAGKKHDPPLIGFAGPYHLAQFGAEQPVWTIFADRFYIFKEDEQIFRKHPRRSVELWEEADPKKRYFDPISVLGAETPALDLGILYRRASSHIPVRRYSYRAHLIKRYSAAAAVMPSGTNTFAPSGTDLKKKNHDKEADPVALSPDEIHQLVDALRSLPEFQFVQEQMKASGGADNGEALSPIDGDGGANEGDPAKVADANPSNEPAPKPEDEQGKTKYESAGDRAIGTQVDDVGGGRSTKDGSYNQEEMEGDWHHKYEKMRKYAADGDMDSFKKHYAEMNDDDRVRCMKYAMAPDAKDDKVEANPTGVDEPKPSAPKTEDLTEKRPMQHARPGASQPQIKAAIDPESQIKFAKLERENSDLKQRYAKLEQTVAGIENGRRKAVRYAKLKGLEAEGYSFNPEEEIADVASMSEEEWTKHQSRIVKHYQRVPIGRVLPQMRPEQLAGQLAKDEASIEESKQAMELAQAEKIPYAKARQKVKALNGVK